MTDRVHIFKSIAPDNLLGIFAVRSVVPGWMNVSNSGPVFGIGTRSPSGLKTVYNTLPAEH